MPMNTTSSSPEVQSQPRDAKVVNGQTQYLVPSHNMNEAAVVQEEPPISPCSAVATCLLASCFQSASYSCPPQKPQRVPPPHQHCALTVLNIMPDTSNICNLCSSALCATAK